MAKFTEILNRHIMAADPDNVCFVATHSPDGYYQASPRGSERVRTFSRKAGARRVVLLWKRPTVGPLPRPAGEGG